MYSSYLRGRWTHRVPSHKRRRPVQRRHVKHAGGQRVVVKGGPELPRVSCTRMTMPQCSYEQRFSISTMVVFWIAIPQPTNNTILTMSYSIGPEILERYLALMGATKTVDSNIFLLELSNHAAWFSSVDPLRHPTYQEKISLEVRLRNDRDKFAFYVMAKAIHESPCFRFDSAGMSHRNNLPDIPLTERKVDTPHFAKFDDRGRWIAYRTQRLDSEPQLAKDIQPSLLHFFDEADIKIKEAAPLEIVCKELVPQLDLGAETDPHSGVIFP